jgi:TorA maturation chaperone TorD
MEKLIVTAAVTGGASPAGNTAKPKNPNEIVTATLECYNAGASVVHIHALNPETSEPEQKPKWFDQAIVPIREQCDIIVNVMETDSTGTERQEGTINKGGDEYLLGPDHAGTIRDRAGMFGFLGSLFNHRVDADFVGRLRGAGISSLLVDDRMENIRRNIRVGLDEMSGFIQAVDRKTDKEIEQELAVDWTRLFRGVSPEYGPPPPFEGLYVKGGTNSHEVLETVLKCYRENGFSPDPVFQNRPDYIGMELDFLGLLSEREAEALEAGDMSNASGYLKTVRSFLLEHLGTWCGDFCDRAIVHAKTGFYRGALQVTKGIVSGEVDSEAPPQTDE